MTEPGVPRAGYPVFAGEEQVGEVTSGTMSPSLRVGIALALVKAGFEDSRNPPGIGIRSRKVGAEVVKTPFIKK